jgi:hypothetical protein
MDTPRSIPSARGGPRNRAARLPRRAPVVAWRSIVRILDCARQWQEVEPASANDCPAIGSNFQA